MPPIRSGPGDGDRAAAVSADLAEQVKRIRREVTRTRERTLRVTAAIAATERRLAQTLRGLAETARRGGRPADAERLDRYASSAEEFADVEQGRADEDGDHPGPA